MILTQTMVNTPVRNIKAKVVLYNGSTLANTFYSTDALKSVTIERIGENKFFGFGICHKANIKLRDVNRELSFTTSDRFKIYFDNSNGYVAPFPLVTVSEVNRDENTGELSITAYDKLIDANKHTVSEVDVESYTVENFAKACARVIGLGAYFKGIGEDETCLDTEFINGANFEGTETIREALNAVAEATQTVYYLNESAIVFKRINTDNAQAAIYPKDYFTLKTRDNRRVGAITSATELGDNITATSSTTGTNIYIKDNPFWELRDDVSTLVENALAAVDGLTMAQLELEWRGNYLIEIGDCIEVIGKDLKAHRLCLLNDSITYNGALKQSSKWEYSDVETVPTNPTTIGEAIKQTYAKVDKANKTIDLVAQETTANSEELAQLNITTENISTTVSQVETTTNDAIADINATVVNLSTNLNQTAEELNIAISKIEDKEVTRVTTTTNFTFNEQGLKIASTGKTESNLETVITEDGMKVYREEEPVLVANNEGVKAIDLHATTYLIVGTNSRLENYKGNRTACYWIGG